MRKHAILSLAMGLVSTAFTQTQSFKVSGTVKDAADKPIANAIVELLRAKVKDTTGADGAYSLNLTAMALRRPDAASAGEMSLRKGFLELVTARAAPIRVEIFDVKGNLVDRLAVEMASAGTWRLDLAGRVRSPDLVIVKATVGRTARAFPYLRTGFGAAPANPSLDFSAPAGAPAGKASAALDTLQITASGFASKRVEVNLPETLLDVTLDISADIWGGLKNTPGKSSGCGKPAAFTNGLETITSSGEQREYAIEIPANYDPATPYRLFFVGHGIPGRAADVPRGEWWGIKPMATAANIPAVWVAPGAVTGASGRWSTTDGRDHVLFDDITAALKAGLCIDTTRIFATGMSGGGMLTNSLTSDRQRKIRAGVAFAPTNFNIWIPNPPLKEPVAWMQTTGMSDNLCAWVTSEAQRRGAKFIALEKAANNGCTIPAEIPTWKSGNHVCYEFAGCKPGYPTKVCTFNGGHVHFNSDPGSNVNWIAKEAWDFFMQF